MKYTFGDIVVVDGDNIGVIVKSWFSVIGKKENEPTYDVYVRMYNGIKEYSESEIQRYLVRHKFLSEEEREYQDNAINNRF